MRPAQDDALDLETTLAELLQVGALARTVDPDVRFTDPEKFRTFEATLLREAASPADVPSPTADSPAPLSPSESPP